MTQDSAPPSREMNWAQIDLGPDLPPVVFTSTEHWHQQRIGALAIYCSDGRWGEAFDEFCQKHLQLPRYDRWAVAGGPAWLTAGEKEPAYFQVARGQLDFLVRTHNLDRIVLITHYGCGHYGHRLGLPPRECLPAQLHDVHIGADLLRNWYPDMTVQAYLAMQRGSCLSFHQL